MSKLIKLEENTNIGAKLINPAKSPAKERPEWWSRPILDQDHYNDLEFSAAENEFGKEKMARPQAEEAAYKAYIKQHRIQAVAHHWNGMRIAEMAGDKESALKHGTMYKTHLQALGHTDFDRPPPEVLTAARNLDQTPYKFKAHKADMFAVDQYKAGEVAKAELVDRLTTIYKASKVLIRVEEELKKAESESFLAKAAGNLRAAAFRHRVTGQVVETGPFHDLGQLPNTENNDDADVGFVNWTDGFTTHDGNFLTREEAAAHVGMGPKRWERKWLDSQDPEAGLNKANGEMHELPHVIAEAGDKCGACNKELKAGSTAISKEGRAPWIYCSHGCSKKGLPKDHFVNTGKHPLLDKAEKRSTPEKLIKRTAVCRCKSYHFPHRKGGGKCK
jgi:hypothetical protein